jgi:HAE1 family hydrophobic/amphiphilic exporter-1
LRRHGSTLDEVAGRLASAGISVPAGRLSLADGDRLLRADLRYRSREEVLAVPVRVDGEGRWLRVGDLVDPAATRIEAQNGSVIITTDGRDSIACKVLKRNDADARAVKERVMAETAAFLASHPGVPVQAVPTLDSTTAIDDAIGVLNSNLLQGMALVLIILTVFIGVRAATITLSGMALSFLGCLVYFWATGSSINELSLLGFVIVVGVLVDDAVVVIDNITQHRERGEPLEQALVEGTAEVFWPVISSVATTIAAFLPLLLMTGAVGDFFSLIPVAVAVALAISVFEAVLMVPLHVRDLDHLLGPPKLHAVASEGMGHLGATGLIGWLARQYDRVLTTSLRLPWLTVGGTVLLFLLAAGVLVQSAVAPGKGWKPLVKLEFFPSDPQVAQITITAPTGTPLAETDRIVRQIASDLHARGPGEVASASGFAGLQVDTTYKPQWGNQYGMIQVELAGRGARTHDDPLGWIAARAEELRTTWAERGVRVHMEAQQGGPPTGKPINVRLSGLDDAAVRRATEAALAWMQGAAVPGGQLAGAVDIASDIGRTEAVLALEPDRDRSAARGIPEAQALALAGAVVEGAYGGDLRRSDDDVPVRVKLASNDLAVLAETPLRQLPDGSILRWSDIGTVRPTQEAAALIRRDFVRTITIIGSLRPDATINAFSATSAVDDWWKINGAAHPGVSIAFGGEAESTGRSYASLAMSFMVAIFLIYTILAMQFHSYLQPLLIMSTIVFAFTGVALSMGIFGAFANLVGPSVVRPERALFTVNTFIAIIGLTGMVVNNAIVLIDFINARKGSAPLPEVLRRASHLRLRPILLTSITTMAGMLPTAIGIPEFSLTWSPMAMAFVTGLGLSTVLCLVVVPVLYELLDRWVGRVRGWRRKDVATAA